jgi:phage shock protein A
MENQMAHLMASFGVGDQTDTLNRMTERIDERLSEARARTEVANQGIDTQMAQIDLAASKGEAENLYSEYQKQLGLVPDSEPPAKTMETIPVQPAEEQKTAPPAEQQTNQ